jgi:hypothetical protein
VIDELAGSDYPADELEHPAIRTARQTCEGSPDQWEGELHDGRHFYFRYRWGRASLALGPTAKSVAGITGPFPDDPGVWYCVISHGDPMRGSFDSDAERCEVFARLVTEDEQWRASH